MKDADTSVADASPPCSPTARFDAPIQLAGVALPGIFEQSPRLTPDELTIYFSGYGLGGDANLYVAHRNSRFDAFDAPVLVLMLNTSLNEFDPAVSADNLTIWFSSNRISMQGTHLYVAIRPSTLTQFGSAALATTNAPDVSKADIQPFLTFDGQELWFSSDRAGTTGFDLLHATRIADGFGPPVPALELNSSANDELPTLSADRLSVYFASERTTPNTRGGLDIWTSHRSTVQDGFSAPQLADELNTPDHDLIGWLSMDNCRLYGARFNTEHSVLFVASR